MHRRVGWTSAALLSVIALGCDGPVEDATWDQDRDLAAEHLDDGETAGDRQRDDAPGWVCPDTLPYASEVVSFTPGVDAGYGQLAMPSVVLGPPPEGPPTAGSLDVVSLGVGGEIVLSFGERAIVDGPGPDLIVWENVFQVGADPDAVFAELGEVAVSDDGETWTTFVCDPNDDIGYDVGCAGWRPRQAFDPCQVVPLVPEVVGGDGFDLADLGLAQARYVRIRDLATLGGAPSAGFDLDAVGGVHFGD